ncbi:hypothetical protein ULVI_12740 [Cochleicola gelatinilyticus]|uniref:Uncharacterized protein n=1 Tax=Cochleicola gelatinilyticus TaxID=1763537 RepID=A0A167G9L8_9FLAO|nr:hypothetical protein ULVI_12740 [Cochleicola gelatinilyticus]
MILYTFEISNTYKIAAEAKTIQVFSRAHGESCGYMFEMGKSYLVYTRRSSHFSSQTKNASDLITGLCDRNQSYLKVKNKEFRKLKRLQQ